MTRIRALAHPSTGYAAGAAGFLAIAVAAFSQSLKAHALDAALSHASWCGLNAGPAAGQAALFGHCAACWVGAGAVAAMLGLIWKAQRA